MIQEMPLDGLSASLYELKDELAAMSEEGRRALLKEMNCPDDGESDSLNLTPEAIERFISDFTK